MKPEDQGYSQILEKFKNDNKLDQFELGRVIAEHRERYTIKTDKGEFDAEITGHLRFSAKSREDFPAVGDWVAMSVFDSELAIIHQIYPRFSTIKRQAVGQSVESQIIATNIDFALLVQAVDRDFNINRLERYLTICHSAKVSPIIVLTKIDLIAELRLSEILENIKVRIKGVPVLAISNESQPGFEQIKKILERGKTYCMLGSSGVGKSTLINNLSGKTIMQTDSVSSSTNKGRHVTSHRELTVLENGAILIDNPGMREVGIADSTNGLETTFDTIVRLSQSCRFIDCTHTSELGCSVREAVDKGELNSASYNNYLKMEREKKHFESTEAEKRKKDKEFGKMMKNYKKGTKRNQF